jgi:hypothetical protein
MKLFNFGSKEGGAGGEKTPMNITPRVEAEENIEKSEEKLLAFLPELITIYGVPEGSRVEAVLAAAANKGNSVDNIISKLALYYKLPANAS